MNNSSENNSGDDEPPGLWHKIKSLFRSTPQTTEDVVAMVGAATRDEIIDADAKRIIEGALEVAEKQARDIMIPRTQMTVLKAADSFADNLQKIIETGHSRYPVVGETIDDVLGLLLTKDLLGLITSGEVDDTATEVALIADSDNPYNILDLLRPPVFVPESKRLNVLLRQFREDRNHMALVIDEYGTLAGLVTIEDVLEEIVGEIEDEHDNYANKNIRKISETHYVLSALTPIMEFNEFFSSNIDAGEFDTIGGLVTNKFGHLPKRNESVSIDDYAFHVMQADSRRLRMLRVTLPRADDEGEKAAAG
ncbi:MAG: CBS domain-containing protein [Gammaproteobacteria bacterium]|nr:CBS domain-containing protein [Gammaproteobacteria bacterium]